MDDDGSTDDTDDIDELALDALFVEGDSESTQDPFAEAVTTRAALMGFEAVRILAMGEIRLLVFARKNFADSGRIHSIEAASVPTGIAGLGTNKGGVVLKMYVCLPLQFSCLCVCVCVCFCNHKWSPLVPTHQAASSQTHSGLCGPIDTTLGWWMTRRLRSCRRTLQRT